VVAARLLVGSEVVLASGRIFARVFSSLSLLRATLGGGLGSIRRATTGRRRLGARACLARRRLEFLGVRLTGLLHAVDANGDVEVDAVLHVARFPLLHALEAAPFRQRSHHLVDGVEVVHVGLDAHALRVDVELGDLARELRFGRQALGHLEVVVHRREVGQREPRLAADALLDDRQAARGGVDDLTGDRLAGRNLLGAHLALFAAQHPRARGARERERDDEYTGPDPERGRALAQEVELALPREVSRSKVDARAALVPRHRAERVAERDARLRCLRLPRGYVRTAEQRERRADGLRDL